MESKNNSLLERYLREKSNRGYSERTVETYRVIIRAFLNFLDGKTLEKVTREDIEKYLEYLRQKRNEKSSEKEDKLKLMTIKCYLKITSLFLEWLQDNDLMLKNPARKITKEIRVERTKKGSLSLSDVRKLVRSATNPRDRAIILIMGIAGLRRSEVGNLRVNDINLETSEINVKMGKGKKDRVVVMDEELVESLKVWLVYRESMNPDVESLFCDLQGTKRLSNFRIYCVVKKVAKKAGLQKVYPHKLRHSAATFMRDSGMDLLDIKEQLGHSSISTTEGYIDANVTKRKQGMSRMPSLNVMG